MQSGDGKDEEEGEEIDKKESEVEKQKEERDRDRGTQIREKQREKIKDKRKKQKAEREREKREGEIRNTEKRGRLECFYTTAFASSISHMASAPRTCRAKKTFIGFEAGGWVDSSLAVTDRVRPRPRPPRNAHREIISIAQGRRPRL